MSDAPEPETIAIAKLWSWLPAVTVEIACDPSMTVGVKLGLAVCEAYKTDAVLRGAVLTSADLTGADLTGADLTSAVLRGEKITRIFASASRLDGYTFYGVELEAGGWKINAGCRWFTEAQFRAHVAAKYPNTDKATETLAIIDFLATRAAQVGAAPAKEIAA